MAELLVFNRAHWMDALDKKQLDEYVKKYPKFMDKYNSRTQKGDIVQIRDDGFFTAPNSGYDKDNYDLVIVKGKTREELLHLMGALKEDRYTEIVDRETGQRKLLYTPKTIKKFKANIASYENEKEVSLASIAIKAI